MYRSRGSSPAPRSTTTTRYSRRRTGGTRRPTTLAVVVHFRRHGRHCVLHHADSVFRIADIRAALPGVSDQTIRLALDSLKTEPFITPEGVGRGAVWRRSGKD